jgi:hypothetical protein
MKTERTVRVESDGWHLWRVVDATTGVGLMCGLCSESHARGWATGHGWKIVGI